MNGYMFTTGGKQYARIDKRQAKRIFEEGGTVTICPCNLKPLDGCTLTLNRDTQNGEFRKIVNDFEFDNCTNYISGKYATFYTCID